jgi:1,6-anhydro-N-acetylmuramate kinase
MATKGKVITLNSETNTVVVSGGSPENPITMEDVKKVIKQNKVSSLEVGQ